MRDSKGRFIKGPDPDRHIFTREECQDGFWAAITSIVTRYPEYVRKNGDHVVVSFLKKSGREHRSPV